MIGFCALHPCFYDVFHKNPQLVLSLPKLNSGQRELIQDVIDKEKLIKSAISYFQSEILCLNDEIVCYDESDSVYFHLYCKDGFIYFEDEKNPALSLLKRKYRWYVIFSLKFDKSN